MYIRLALNSQRFTHLCLLSAGIEGTCHHAQLRLAFFLTGILEIEIQCSCVQGKKLARRTAPGPLPPVLFLRFKQGALVSFDRRLATAWSRLGRKSQ